LSLQAVFLFLQYSVFKTSRWWQRTELWTGTKCCKVHERNSLLLHETSCKGKKNKIDIKV
jgi:hypothetical protein